MLIFCFAIVIGGVYVCKKIIVNIIKEIKK